MEQLEKMLAKEPKDAFLLYSLGLECKKANRPQQALDYLQRVITADPGYCYAYYQMGQIYESLDNTDAARSVYRAGSDAARKTGDAHALGEIEVALSML
jgi:tetratricopeptide (TPR) repeat protein